MERDWSVFFHATVALTSVSVMVAWVLSIIVFVALSTESRRLLKYDIPKETRTADVAAVAATLGVVLTLVAVCIRIGNDPLLDAPPILLAADLVSAESVVTLIATLMLRWELRDIAATLHDE